MIPSSSSSSSSSSSANVLVEKATSEFLIGPDWTMNINICDTINSNRWLAKDVVKAVKKRLQHKNPKVQLLSLTLLETMVKNCGDYVHVQIAEKNILQDMTKIVKKKIDMQVREKILVLLSSWQDAFGGAGGRLPQYYWAYEELRRSGVEFPRRSSDAAPIFTPPVTHPPVRTTQVGYGMPINSSTRLDEAMASEIENLSFSSINSMRTALDLLSDMLQAVNPNDREAVKDEIIIDLVERCRSNQKKLMQMLTTTGDEELLGQGLELNDSMQSVLAKHDAIASGTPLPIQLTNLNLRSTTVVQNKPKPNEIGESSPSPRPNVPSAPVVAVTRHQVEEEEEEDDFAQLARRHSKTPATTAQSPSTPTNQSLTTTNNSSGTSAASPSMSNALVVSDQPPPSGTMNEQDMIDFLSLTLSGPATSPHDPTAPTTPPTQTFHQTPGSPTIQGYPQTYQVPSNSYIVPWAQPQPQPQTQEPQTPTVQWSQPRPQGPQIQPVQQPQMQYSTNYPPPPWAASPGYYSNQNHMQATTPRQSFPQANTSYMPLQGGARPLQRGSINGGGGDSRPSFVASGPTPAAGNKTFVPSYRLFEDLNVLGNGDGRFRTSNTSQNLSGSSSGQSIVGGRK
ncbi:hypothetical protein LguiA_032028 [Lonicera macranthoides]